MQRRYEFNVRGLFDSKAQKKIENIISNANSIKLHLIFSLNVIAQNSHNWNVNCKGSMWYPPTHSLFLVHTLHSFSLYSVVNIEPVLIFFLGNIVIVILSTWWEKKINPQNSVRSNAFYITKEQKKIVRHWFKMLIIKKSYNLHFHFQSISDEF